MFAQYFTGLETGTMSPTGHWVENGENFEYWDGNPATVYHQIEARASIVSRRGFDGPLFREGAYISGGGAFNSNKTFDRNLK